MDPSLIAPGRLHRGDERQQWDTSSPTPSPCPSTSAISSAPDDLQDKPLDEGGLYLSRFAASGVLLAFIVICIPVFEQRAAKHAH